MPQQPLALSAELVELLDAVRRQLGLETREQAAEFLAKRRIRRGSSSLTGRGRALYPVSGEQR